MTETVDRTVARRVRELRDRRGWSQADLARRLTELGVKFDRITIAKIEGGSRSVKVGEAVQVAAALGVSPSALLFGGDAEIEIAPNTTLPAAFLRAWNEGHVALRPRDVGFYKAAAPLENVSILDALARAVANGEDVPLTGAGRDMLRAYAVAFRSAFEQLLTLPGGREEQRQALLEDLNFYRRLEEALQ